MICRYGGEEFAVILPNTDTAGALAIAEKIIQHVAELGIANEKSPPGVVTVSCGLYVMSRNATYEKLIQSADAALYHAKRSGKNRVEVYQGS